MTAFFVLTAVIISNRTQAVAYEARYTKTMSDLWQKLLDQDYTLYVSMKLVRRQQLNNCYSPNRNKLSLWHRTQNATAHSKWQRSDLLQTQSAVKYDTNVTSYRTRRKYPDRLKWHQSSGGTTSFALILFIFLFCIQPKVLKQPLDLITSQIIPLTSSYLIICNPF